MIRNIWTKISMMPPLCINKFVSFLKSCMLVVAIFLLMACTKYTSENNDLANKSPKVKYEIIEYNICYNFSDLGDIKNRYYHLGIIFLTYRMKLADQKYGISNIFHSSISFVTTVFLCTNKRNCFENNLKQLKITVL